jgi:signal peptidase I
MFWKKKEKKIKRKKNIIQEYVEAILFAFVVAFLIKNYIFQHFKIPSSSMEQTMLIGDQLYGDRTKFYFTDPERNDIVIFQYPADPEEPGMPSIEIPNPVQKRSDYVLLLKPIYWDKKNWKFKWHTKKNVVKRVIGMPGDEILVRDKEVYINGVIFSEGYEEYIDSQIIPRDHPNLTERMKIYWHENGEKKFMGTRDNFGPVTVPEGKYFVLGDNRDVSKDSRYWGFLDRSDITGTPAFVTFSSGKPPITDYQDYRLEQMGRLPRSSRIRFERFLNLIK